MIIASEAYTIKGLSYTIRSAKPEDAAELSALRLQIDGETEYLDREPGEAYLDPLGFDRLIRSDSERKNRLFLVAEAEGRIVGFCRCEGSELVRFAHKVEFGVCVLQAYWGYAIGRNLIKASVEWADANGVSKMTLNVLETNEKAIRLYVQFGFEVEGVLQKDKRLSDGRFYNTVVMGRFLEK